MASILLAPVAVAYVMDAAPGKPHLPAITLLGASCSFTPLRLLWEQGGSIEAALDLLSDPFRLLLSWSCCGAGWMLTELAQLAARLGMTAKDAKLVRDLQQERAELAEEWLDAKPLPP